MGADAIGVGRDGGAGGGNAVIGDLLANGVVWREVGIIKSGAGQIDGGLRGGTLFRVNILSGFVGGLRLINEIRILGRETEHGAKRESQNSERHVKREYPRTGFWHWHL